MMHTNNPQNHARHQVGLTVALIILISAASLVTGPIRPTSAQVAARSWSYTGSLNTARVSHTATLLHDGKVLVVGGAKDQRAELYHLERLVPAPRIIMASVAGKKLFITGENFHDGAVILLNGEEQKSQNSEWNPGTNLIGKKAGKKIKAGDKLQVRNPDGTVSQEFTFTG